MTAHRFRRPFHLGQAAAIGADRRDLVGIELQQHAAEGIAAAFHIGGELGALDDAAKERSRDHVVLRFLEAGDSGKLFRVGRGKLELAPLAADDRALVGRVDPQLFVGAFAEDRPEVADRQDRAAGGIDVEPLDGDADADFHIGRAERGPVLGHVELDVGQDLFRAAAGGEQGGGLKGGKQLLAVTNDLHGVDPSVQCGGP